MKNYRHFGDEMEILGNRLDYARQTLENSKTAWAQNYWQQTLDRLLIQWRQLPILHDGEALSTIIPRWTVDYNFYELGSLVEGYDVVSRAYEKVFKHDANLDASWNANREARLNRAQY
jgi:hypothetical protein